LSRRSWRNDPNGQPIATDEIQTAGPPAKIILKPDRTGISADGQDICNLEVNLVDDKGVLVPNDDRQIAFEVTGAGKRVGTDNGDLRSSESYKGNLRTTRWGPLPRRRPILPHARRNHHLGPGDVAGWSDCQDRDEANEHRATLNVSAVPQCWRVQ
jgi:hypothetical protein